MALFRAETEHDQIFIEIAAGIEIGGLIVEVDAVAHAAHIEGRSLPAQKVDDHAFPCDDAHARIPRIDGSDHLHALRTGELALLLPVLGDGNHDLVKECKAFRYGIRMSDGEGVERPRKDAFFHTFLAKKKIFVRP